MYGYTSSFLLFLLFLFSIFQLSKKSFSTLSVITLFLLLLCRIYILLEITLNREVICFELMN